jgi:hypothetical protein
MELVRLCGCRTPGSSGQVSRDLELLLEHPELHRGTSQAFSRALPHAGGSERGGEEPLTSSTEGFIRAVRGEDYHDRSARSVQPPVPVPVRGLV